MCVCVCERERERESCGGWIIICPRTQRAERYAQEEEELEAREERNESEKKKKKEEEAAASKMKEEETGRIQLEELDVVCLCSLLECILLLECVLLLELMMMRPRTRMCSLGMHFSY